MRRYILAHTPFSKGMLPHIKPARVVLIQSRSKAGTSPGTYSIHLQMDDGTLVHGDYIPPSWTGDEHTRTEAYCVFLERIANTNRSHPAGSISYIPMGITVCVPPVEIR